MNHSIILLLLPLCILACKPKRSDLKTKETELREKLAKNKVRWEKAYTYDFPDTTKGFLFQLTEYNKDGLAIYTNKYSPGDTTQNTREEYLYDQHKNDTTTIVKDHIGNVIASVKNTYDQKGHNTERRFYTADGALDRKITYTYDQQDLIKELICTDEEGKMIYRYTYTYNKHGDEKQTTLFVKDGVMNSRSELIEDTDTSLHYEVHNNKGELTHQFFNIINEDRLTKEQGTFDVLQHLKQRIVFTYDKNGLITQTITYGQQGLPEQLMKILREQ